MQVLTSAIKHLDSGAKPVTNPSPKNSDFELTIPMRLIKNTRSFKIAWIDFYR